MRTTVHKTKVAHSYSLGVKWIGHQGSNVLTTGQTTVNSFFWTGIRAVPNRPHTFGMALATRTFPTVAQVAYLSGNQGVTGDLLRISCLHPSELSSNAPLPSWGVLPSDVRSLTWRWLWVMVPPSIKWYGFEDTLTTMKPMVKIIIIRKRDQYVCSKVECSFAKCHTHQESHGLLCEIRLRCNTRHTKFRKVQQSLLFNLLLQIRLPCLIWKLWMSPFNWCMVGWSAPRG